MPTSWFNSQRLTVIAVNIDTSTPINNVMAKPTIGPEPKFQSTTATISVVRFESIIATSARLNPLSIAFLRLLPLLNSSFILSNIIIFASTAMPIESIIPAIPGSDKLT